MNINFIKSTLKSKKTTLFLLKKKIIDGLDFLPPIIKILKILKEYEHIYYNSQIGFTLQTMLLLAPICLNDTDDIVKKKFNLVSKFISVYKSY